MDKEMSFGSLLTRERSVVLHQIILLDLTIGIGTYTKPSTVYTVQRYLGLVPEGITILNIEEGL